MQNKNTKKPLTHKQITAYKKGLEKAKEANTKRSKDPKAIAKRFWSKVMVGKPDECWPWTASGDKLGYGRFKITGIGYLSHRVAHKLHYGHCEDGKDCCHKCDNPPCCNPKHLFMGTRLENIHDSISKGRFAIVGRRIGRPKLTPSDVIQIRNLWDMKLMTQRRMAFIYGITYMQVCRIVNREQWKHI